MGGNIRALATGSILVTLNGIQSLQGPPMPVPAGNQPADEKAIGFPGVFGFHVEQSGVSPADYAVSVTQPDFT